MLNIFACVFERDYDTDFDCLCLSIFLIISKLNLVWAQRHNKYSSSENQSQ